MDCRYAGGPVRRCLGAFGRGPPVARSGDARRSYPALLSALGVGWPAVRWAACAGPLLSWPGRHDPVRPLPPAARPACGFGDGGGATTAAAFIVPDRDGALDAVQSRASAAAVRMRYRDYGAGLRAPTTPPKGSAPLSPGSCTSIVGECRRALPYHRGLG